MTTSVTAPTTASLSTAPTTTETTEKDALVSTASISVEETIASLAQSLMGFAARSMPEQTKNQRLFNRIERLVDSIARLVEALATYRGGTSSEQQESEWFIPIPKPINEKPPLYPFDPSNTSDTTNDSTTAPGADSDSIPDGGSSEPPSQSSNTINLGSKLPATKGFLWKPESDKNGKLAILLPKQYTGTIKRVRILNPQGTKVLATGKFSGVGNGNREHFRFTKPGNGFPDGAIVLIEMENGTSRHVKIKDTAKRTEQ